MAIGAFIDLPAALRRLVPEIGDGGWREESRADCARCPMVPARSGADPDAPWAFDDAFRCCTYHPAMASFLVGRALARGGDGAARLRARLADPDGVSAWGIYPREGARARYLAVRDHAFGRDSQLRCPYLGDGGCSVWPDRPGVCRTWYCKHDGGERGAHSWSRLEAALWQAENRLAFLLIELGDAPAEGAGVDAFADWYAWCGDRIETLSDDELARVRVPALAEARDELVQLRRRPAAAMPDLLVPAVSDATTQGDRVRVCGYSLFDEVLARRAVFALLARLDGTTPWRDALAACRADGHDVDEALVAELYRVGAVAPVS